MASKFSQRLVLVWSCLALGAGCGQILGISDYEIDPKLDGEKPGSGGDNAGGEGQSGSKSTAGKSQGGTAGEPEQPQGGSAGEPTNVPLGGEPGVGGDGTGPTSPFVGCNGAPFEGNEAIIRSCILRAGCLIWNYPSDSISRCVSQNTQNTYEGTRCTLDATTCDDFTRCEGTHIEKTFCTGKEPGQYCNGNEVVTCSDYPHARDCTKDGGTCKDFGVALPNGNTVDCSLPAVTTCAATTEEEACGGPQNAYRYQCQDTTAYGTKCSNFAASCQEVSGDIGCYYPLSTCNTEGVTCNNGKSVWCDGASQATYDCKSVGLGCDTSGDYFEDSGRQCLAPGCTNEDAVACEESCSGSKITFCYGGAPITVDCKSYGFKTCAEYDYECDDLIMGDCLHTTDTIHFADCED
jgi:hypothetical protein